MEEQVKLNKQERVYWEAQQAQRLREDRNGICMAYGMVILLGVLWYAACEGYIPFGHDIGLALMDIMKSLSEQNFTAST